MIVKVIHSSYGHETARTLVASIKVDHTTNHLEALEFAYDRTQNVFDSWSNPIAVEVYEQRQDGGNMVTVEAPLHKVGKEVYGLRSSMMGDRFQVVDPDNYDPDLFYVCAMRGVDPCDPVDYRVLGQRLDGQRTSYLVENQSDHFRRDHPEYEPYSGLDYQEQILKS